MKLHHVTISNLNSLYGEHAIDFERDLQGAPLFLIQGKTGAGKSTILDAICLCLFGATPRLARGTGRPDEDARHIMSYGTGTCFASLVFSIRDRDGQRQKWRATWECRRARGKPGGNLQDPDRSVWRIHDDGSEEHLVTDSRKKYFEPHFERILEGMQIEDFQRSVLLAQGQFAAFLRASEHDKATILERLTDTTEYKEIGERAAAKRKEIKQELDALEARLEGLPLLTAQEERELGDALTALNAQIDSARAALERAQQARDLLAKEEEFKGQLTLALERHDAQKVALAARAPDAQRLTSDRLARPHAQALTDHAAALESLAALHAELEVLEAALEASGRELEAATTEEGVAQKGLLEAQGALETIRPRLEAARALAHRAREADKEHQLAGEKAKALEAEHQEAQSQRQGLVDSRGVLDQGIEALETTLKESEHLLQIEPQLAVLEAKLSTLQEVRAHLDTSQTTRDQSQKRAEKLQAKLEETQAKVALLTDQLHPLELAHDQANAQLDHHLQGAPDPDTRRAALEATREGTRQIAGHIDQAIALHDALVALADSITQTRAQEHDAQARLEHAERSLAHLQTMVTHTLGVQGPLEQLHHDLDQILVLTDTRRALKDQDPCPLCGSTTHPYHSDHLPQFEAEQVARRDDIARRLEAIASDLDAHRASLREAEIEHAALQARIDSLVEQRATLRAQSAQTLSRHNGARHRAGLEALALDTFPPSEAAQAPLRHVLEEARGLTQLGLAQTEAALEALGAAARAHALAAKRFTAAEGTLRLLQSELDHTAEAHATALDAVREADKNAQTWTTRCDTLTADLRATFHAHKLAPEDAPLASLPTLLHEIRADLEGRARGQGQLDQKRQERETLSRDLRSKVQTLESLGLQREEAQAELGRRAGALGALRADLATMLEGGDPDEMERQHRDAIRAAQDASTLASARRSEAQTELATQRTRRAERQRVERDLVHKVKAFWDTLEEALKTLGLGSLEDLQAMLLQAQERQRLEHEIGTLERGVEHAALDIARLQSALTAHQEALGQEELGFLREQDLEAWRGDCSRLKEQLEGMLGERGAMDEKVRIQKEAAGHAATYKKELAKTRKTFGVWETLFKLIGRKDGDSFKLFAQSLNLQELIDRANHRLARLNPRYALAAATSEEGEPVLDFAVCDHHQADTRRPLTTLSGGETFLVSLALALALADFRRLDMPIETLLLDEGFGTLDQATLDTAMVTLRQLQQENLQQVGIISHVEVLKERVEARVVVEKLGNGRSTLRVEHGAGS